MHDFPRAILLSLSFAAGALGHDFPPAPATPAHEDVTTTGYAANIGMKWKTPEMNSVGADWGQAPAVVEGISATLTFPAWPRAEAWASDERGQRRIAVPLKTEGSRTVLETSPEWKTLWYEIDPGCNEHVESQHDAR